MEKGGGKKTKKTNAEEEILLLAKKLRRRCITERHEGEANPRTKDNNSLSLPTTFQP